jgi:HSP20 family protein
MNRFSMPTFTERMLSTGTIAPVDVCESEREFVIRMACPGCRPDDIEVTVEMDTIRIRGKFMDHEMMGQTSSGQPMGGQQPGGQSAGGQRTGGHQAGQTNGPHGVCLIRELPTGRFERDITLPTPVDAKGTHASFEYGLLTLTCPKTQAAMGQRIQITQGAGAGNR